jgi:hypothetical protein
MAAGAPETTESDRNYTIFDGTGPFASAAGTITDVVSAFTVAAPAGGGGIFGGGSFSDTGFSNEVNLSYLPCRSAAGHFPVR